MGPDGSVWGKSNCNINTDQYTRHSHVHFHTYADKNEHTGRTICHIDSYGYIYIHAHFGRQWRGLCHAMECIDCIFDRSSSQ